MICKCGVSMFKICDICGLSIKQCYNKKEHKNIKWYCNLCGKTSKEKSK